MNERYIDECMICQQITWMQDDDTQWITTCESCGTYWARDEDAYFAFRTASAG